MEGNHGVRRRPGALARGSTAADTPSDDADLDWLLLAPDADVAVTDTAAAASSTELLGQPPTPTTPASGSVLASRSIFEGSFFARFRQRAASLGPAASSSAAHPHPSSQHGGPSPSSTSAPPPPPISHAHWRHPSTRETCANSACGRTFGSTRRRCWCHRCGDIFCPACLGHRRRLSPQARPDPVGGTFYPVCAVCARPDDADPTGPPTTRTLTRRFVVFRQAALDGRRSTNPADLASSSSSGGSAMRLACARLAAAYLAAPPLSRAAGKLGLFTPEWAKCNWQQPAPRAATAASAATAATGFGRDPPTPPCPACGATRATSLPQRLRSSFRRSFSRSDSAPTSSSPTASPFTPCCVCGVAHCADCLFASLQVYPCDGSAKVALVSPAFEPPKAVVLSICRPCLDAINSTVSRRFALPQPAVQQLCALYPSFPNLEAAIMRALPAYQALIDGMARGAHQPRNAVQLLAKHQSDLVDLLAKYADALNKLKALFRRATGAGGGRKQKGGRVGEEGGEGEEGEEDEDEEEGRAELGGEDEAGAESKLGVVSSTNRRLLEQVLRAKAGFYRENLWAFRALKHDLAQTVSKETLDLVSRVMDTQALNYALCLCKQLAIEALAFKELEPFVLSLKHAIDAITGEYEDAVLAASDNWKEHLDASNALLAENGRANPMIRTYHGHPDWLPKAKKKIDRVLRVAVTELAGKATLQHVHASLTLLRKAWDVFVATMQELEKEDGDWVDVAAELAAACPQP